MLDVMHQLRSSLCTTIINVSFGTVLKQSVELDILRVTFDSKMTFEKHFRSVSRATSQRLGILRKSW